MIMIRVKSTTTRPYIGHGLIRVNCKIPGMFGLSMPPIPFTPSVNLSAFIRVIGTISPKPRVTIAR